MSNRSRVPPLARPAVPRAPTGQLSSSRGPATQSRDLAPWVTRIANAPRPAVELFIFGGANRFLPRFPPPRFPPQEGVRAIFQDSAPHWPAICICTNVQKRPPFLRARSFTTWLTPAIHGAAAPAFQQRSRSAQLERSPKSQVLPYKELATASAKLFSKLERVVAWRLVHRRLCPSTSVCEKGSAANSDGS
jgi:hypothetical protein